MAEIFIPSGFPRKGKKQVKAFHFGFDFRSGVNYFGTTAYQ